MRAERPGHALWWPLVCALVWVPISWAPISLALAQQPEPSSNYGREAREGPPVLWRDSDVPLSPREQIHHALSRFTFGATSELIDHVEKVGLSEWMKDQLSAGEKESQFLLDRLATMESLEITTQEIVQKYNLRQPPRSATPTPEEIKKRAEARRLRTVPRDELKDAVLLLAIYGNNQLLEVACDFWRNHFNVDVSKGNVRYYATTYEREVIRGEALGTFARMLNKQARHPAMLIYLDNYVSRATPRGELVEIGQKALRDTRDYAAALEAVDIAKMRGINENYARELMELHTLGVDNYYTQEDVITVANALTGWTVQQNADKPITFEFRPDMHASEPRLFLRRNIPPVPVNPEREGQAILDALARHRGTAEFIAYKLCRYYVSDNPPKTMVRRVARVFSRRRTTLPAVYEAIFRDPEFNNPKHYQAKFKRPFEFVVSALRVTGAEVTTTGDVHRALRSMSEPLYQCEDPTGYYDQADAWRDPGVMATRWQFALNLGMEQVRGVRIPDSFWEGMEPNNPLQWKDELTRRILPGGCTERTSEALDAVIGKYARFNPTPEQMGRYIVGILLGSPEFQRQ